MAERKTSRHESPKGRKPERKTSESHVASDAASSGVRRFWLSSFRGFVIPFLPGFILVRPCADRNRSGHGLPSLALQVNIVQRVPDPEDHPPVVHPAMKIPLVATLATLGLCGILGSVPAVSAAAPRDAAPFAGRMGGQAAPPAEALSLWYRSPAAVWTEALPLGNGRLGAMVFGGIDSERLQLNEATLWAGGPYDPGDPEAPAALPEARRLIFAGKYAEATRLVGQHMMARPLRQTEYQPLGDLVLEFPDDQGR